MTPKESLLQRMQEMGVSPKRSLGQNFLINPNTINKIIEAVVKTKAPSLLEIGPGLGALTEHLRQMPLPLTVIEMDFDFIKYWRSQGLNVIEGDALKLTWNELPITQGTTLVSNLPYQIAARLVIELTSEAPAIENMVLMFQREVADRMMAKASSKDYGFLSVVAQLGWDVKKVVDAGSRDFFPPPRVLSRVLGFKRRAVVSIELVEFVKKAFENRRKMMLKNFGDRAPALADWLNNNGHSEKVRAEELSSDEFLKLFEVWKQNGN